MGRADLNNDPWGRARGQSKCDGVHSVFLALRLILSGFFAQILEGGYVGERALDRENCGARSGRKEAGLAAC